MKELTLVGRGASSKECPFCTEEVWGTASVLITDGLKDKHYTKVFAQDSSHLLDECFAIAKERNIAIVSTLNYATEKYPLREVIRDFRVSYFKNTASYMLAMAIHQKYERIYVYGFEQDTSLNYVLIRPWVTFWFGAAHARGIDMIYGKGVLIWQHARLPLRQFLNDEEFAQMEEELGFKLSSNNQ